MVVVIGLGVSFLLDSRKGFSLRAPVEQLMLLGISSGVHTT